MQKSIKKSILFLVGAFVFCSSLVWAQNPTEAVKPTPAEVQKKKPKLIWEGIGLTDKEKQALLPLHQEYQAQLSKIANFNDSFLNQLNGQGELLDDEAWIKLDYFIEFQRQKANLQKKYVAKFRKIIPPKKAAKYFLWENRLEGSTSDNLVSSATGFPQPAK